ncbi:hypothetical protein [Flectobacillus major]|jgi:hypothetical protein|uniref:hypothetical protein n=1 Tax=Flectobacillus major TaxID=103 RepID=UPI00047B4143|nr:hypothetical protein [Flectobacillus major]
MRKKKNSDEYGISFRYAVDSKQVADLICSKLKEKDIIHSFNVSSIDGSYVIIIDDIDKVFFDAEYINKLNKEININRESFDFFVYLTSNNMMGGMSISNKIIDYIRIIGGNSIEISYVII